MRPITYSVRPILEFLLIGRYRLIGRKPIRRLVPINRPIISIVLQFWIFAPNTMRQKAIVVEIAQNRLPFLVFSVTFMKSALFWKIIVRSDRSYCNSPVFLLNRKLIGRLSRLNRLIGRSIGLPINRPYTTFYCTLTYRSSSGTKSTSWIAKQSKSSRFKASV